MFYDYNAEIMHNINMLCKNAYYEIISVKDVKKCISDGELDDKSLTKYLEELSDMEYVNVKYRDENEICLAVLPKGRAVEYYYNRREKENKKLKREIMKYTVLSSILTGSVFALSIIVYFIIGKI
ncbi:MAG: hypothetical protein IJR66_01635 [Clostridia bacterium]|nr:hypothetical protein [Clostridia bacterium]